MTKPFSLRELRARIRAHLRRIEPARTFRFGDCELNLDRAELRKSGHPVEVTARELRLLEVFAAIAVGC